MAIKSDPVVPVKEEGDEKTIKIRSVAAEFNRLTLFANLKTDTALEYPQFLAPDTRRMPDSIGRDALSEVK